MAVRKLLWPPSLADVFFAVLLLVLFAQPGAWQALLSDGDTGWHIRTGQYILQHGSVPAHDLFSFSRPGQPWFAWEWLSDVIFARVYTWGNLLGVAVMSALVLVSSAVLLFLWILRRGAGLGVALPVTLAAVSASSVHYLARPHIFSLLLFTVALWTVDEDRRRRTPWLWCLVPLTALWANLHAGFLAWLAVLGLLVLLGGAARRYGVLAAACGAATLANPYGWRLHQHIFQYLGSSWILDNVTEFQSPRIRSENMTVFAVLLLAGVAIAARREWLEAALVWLWGFAALRSARHIPLYAIAAAPAIAASAAAWWRARAGERPSVRVLWELSQDLGKPRPVTPWVALFGGLALAVALPVKPVTDFSPQRFPVAALNANPGLRAAPRVLTSDQWGDYLIYRFYPDARIFFDGRSDFYGPAIGADYQELLAAGPKWRESLDRYGFETALLPLDWPLGRILERDPDWHAVYRDSQAVLLVRGSQGIALRADMKNEGTN